MRITKLNIGPVDCPKQTLCVQSISAGSEKEKRERSAHMRDNKKDFFVEMLLMYNGEDIFPQNEMWKHHTLEGKLCKRKGKSKGKIILLQKKYRRLLE